LHKVSGGTAIKTKAVTSHNDASGTSTRIFGLALTAVFAGTLLLNAIFY